MTSNALLQPEPQAIVACTISRDVQNFDLLIEDMETVLGESWGDLTFVDALPFFEQPEAAQIEFVAVALDDSDEEDLTLVGDIITTAKDKGIKVILIADDLTQAALHTLLRMGADEFIPYPLPENELGQAIERLQAPPPAEAPLELQSNLKATGDRNGVLLAVHGMAGGTGATTLAVNLAWELANVEKENGPRVCLIDLDLQFGSVSTYLDLPRRDSVFELLSDTESMDSDSFMHSLLTYNEKLHVFTSPSDMLPLDMLEPVDVKRILDIACANFDYVVLDMPSSIVSWTEGVLQEAAVYFATMELEMRSAQNTQRMKRLLQGEDLPFEKLRFVLNRAPKFTDLNGKSRIKRLSESLGISIEVQMPDGGKPVAHTSDQGVVLGDGAAKNPLRKEIAKLAKSIHEVNASEAVGG
jgi:pilus assembly protein CpaE